MNVDRIVLLGTALLLAGCAGRPSESLAEEAVRARLDNGNRERLRVVDFQKTDGQAAELAGVQLYTLHFTGFGEFVDGAYYKTSGFNALGDVSITTTPATKRPPTCAEDLAACISAPPMLAAKGDRLRLSGTVTFEKRESGWHAVEVNLTLPDGAEIRHDALVGENARRNEQIRTTAQPNGVRSSLPSHVREEHRAMLTRWLETHPSFRLADAQDCQCDQDFQSARSTMGYGNDHPYYVTADFNGDNQADLAVTVIDTSKDPASALRRTASGDTVFDQTQGFNAGIVVFNGPATADMNHSFMQNGIGSSGGAVLFYRQGTLLTVGNFSHGSSLKPEGSGYVLLH